MNTLQQLPHREKVPAGWTQPDTKDIGIDDEYAIMTEETFQQLMDPPTYNATDAWVGKLWRTPWQGVWYLSWYGPSDKPDQCSGNHRKILIA